MPRSKQVINISCHQRYNLLLASQHTGEKWKHMSEQLQHKQPTCLKVTETSSSLCVFSLQLSVSRTLLWAPIEMLSSFGCRQISSQHADQSELAITVTAQISSEEQHLQLESQLPNSEILDVLVDEHSRCELLFFYTQLRERSHTKLNLDKIFKKTELTQLSKEVTSFPHLLLHYLLHITKKEVSWKDHKY